jgi:hypothetical protein
MAGGGEAAPDACMLHPWRLLYRLSFFAYRTLASYYNGQLCLSRGSESRALVHGHRGCVRSGPGGGRSAYWAELCSTRPLELSCGRARNCVGLVPSAETV